jgi:hypothetical protein
MCMHIHMYRLLNRALIRIEEKERDQFEVERTEDRIGIKTQESFEDELSDLFVRHVVIPIDIRKIV